MIAGVTPTQLYERLLAGTTCPRSCAQGARRFRYGRSEMQIHFALSEPRALGGRRAARPTAIVHLTPGLDGVSRAVNEAERGLLPAEATVVVGQPLTIDPCRAPEGKGMLWIQLQELPWRLKGDAAGELDVGDGTWSDELRERYADRIQARLARHIPNLESSIVRARRARPARPRAANVNLVGTATRTAVRSRSTRTSSGGRSRAAPGTRPRSSASGTSARARWPGPGLGAGSGTLVAHRLLRPPASRRALTKLRALTWT